MFISHTYREKVKETITLALPIIAGQLGQVLMGFFDTVQIGGLGHEYIAASGFANGLYWMITLLGMGVLFAVSPLVSEAIGEKKEEKSVGVLYAGMLVSAILSVVFMLLIWWMAASLEILKHSETDNRLGAQFLNTVNWSTGFIFFFMAGKQFLDGLGKTKVGMYITIAGLIANYFFNRIFIYGAWSIPAMGIEGAAIANSLARLLMTVALFLYIFTDTDVRKLREVYAKSEHHYTEFIKPILVIGIPAGLQFFLEVGAFNAGQIMSGWLSTVAEAAHMIAIGLASITFMVLSGVAHAGTILVGYAYGAKDHDGMRMSGYTAIGITFIIELIFAAGFLIFRHELPLLYTQETAVLGVASTMLVFAAFFQLSDGLQACGAGLLRGMQDVKFPALIAFVSYWIVMVPLGYFLAFPLSMGLSGIWIGFVVGLSVAAIAFLWRFQFMLKKLVF